MRIEHAAMYVNDIEAEKKFFQYVIDNSGGRVPGKCTIIKTPDSAHTF